MRDDLRDDVLQGLREALLVTPSPEFVARVREHVRQNTAPWWQLGMWRFAMASAVVVVAVTGVWMWPSMDRARLASVPADLPDSVAQVVPTSAPVTRIAPTAPVVASATEPAHPVPQVLRVTRRRAEILVPDDQRVLLNRLITAVRDGRAVVPAPGGRVLEDEDGRMVEPRSIEIPLMKAIELLPGTPASGSGSRNQ